MGNKNVGNGPGNTRAQLTTDSDGSLRLTGTPGDDTISVSRKSDLAAFRGEKLQGEDAYLVTVNDQDVFEIPQSKSDRLTLDGGAGNDEFWIDRDSKFPGKIDDRQGNNYVSAAPKTTTGVISSQSETAKGNVQTIPTEERGGAGRAGSFQESVINFFSRFFDR